MDDFPIVDPHRHLWDLERFSYPWLSARPLPASVAGCRANREIDYLADTARQNLVKSVHVDAGLDPSRPVEETRRQQSIADQRGFPHGIVVRAELHRPDVETTLAAHRQFPNVRGIRRPLISARSFLSKAEQRQSNFGHASERWRGPRSATKFRAVRATRGRKRRDSCDRKLASASAGGNSARSRR